MPITELIKISKPVIYGILLIIIGFHISTTVLHGLTVFWMDGLRNAEFTGTMEDYVQRINDGMWYSYPRLVFYGCLASSWFLGGFVAATKAARNRTLSALLSGLISAIYLYINWWVCFLLILTTAFGGIVAMVRTSKHDS